MVGHRVYFAVWLLLEAFFWGATGECLGDLSEQLAEANAYKRAGKLDLAEPIYLDILASDADTDIAFQAQKGLVFCHIAAGRNTESWSAIEKLVTDYRGHAELSEAFFQIARRYKKAELYEEAKAIQGLIAAEFPDSDDASKALKSMLNISKTEILELVKSGRDEEVGAAIDGLIADYDSNPELGATILSIAGSYRRERRYQEAGAIYEKIIATFPDTDEASKAEAYASKMSAFSLIGSGDDDAAGVLIDRLAAGIFDPNSHPDLLATLRRIAKRYEGEGRYDEAKPIYRFIWEYSDGSHAGGSHLELAEDQILFMIDDQDYAGAEQVLDTVIEYYRDDPNVAETIFRIGQQYSNKARLLGNRGLETQSQAHYEKALRIYQRVITDLPPSAATARAYYLSGMHLAQNLDEYPEGIDFFQAVVDNWPDCEHASNAQYYVGMYYGKLKDLGDLAPSEANSKIRKAYTAVVENYKDSRPFESALLELGQMSFAEGQFADAIVHFEMLLAKSPERLCRIGNELAEACDQTGDEEMAEQVRRELDEKGCLRK